MKNKKGYSTIGIIAIIFVALFVVMMAILLSYGTGQVDQTLSSIDFNIGNFSFNDTYQSQMHDGLNSVKTTVPQIFSIGILLGMFIVMLLVGYNMPKTNKAWILLDILILIICEGLAVIVVSSFESYLNSNGVFIDISRDILSQPAKFILNLPIIVPIFGGLLILSTYMLSREKKEEEATADLVPYY